MLFIAAHFEIFRLIKEWYKRKKGDQKKKENLSCFEQALLSGK